MEGGDRKITPRKQLVGAQSNGQLLVYLAQRHFVESK